MATTAYEATRQIPTSYYVDGGDKETSIKKRMEETYNQYISQTQAFWHEARIDQRFIAGDQNLYNELYSSIPSYRRKTFAFNKIRRIINMISGHQRQHRKSTQIFPIEGADEETSEQLSSVLAWAYSKDNFYNTISDSFETGALTTGFSLLSLWLDYTQDFISGDLRCTNLAYNSFMLDHFFRKQDMSDCGFVWTRKWVSKQEAAFLFPDREDEIMELTPPRYGNKDQRFYFMPENFQFTMNNLLPYDEFWYMDTRQQKMLYDLKSGDTLEWISDDKEKLELFLAMNPSVKMKKVTIPTVKLAIVINDKVFYDGPNPLGIDSYPFVPVVGYWDPDNIYFSWRMQGVVRGLRDAQFLYNRRKAIELDILESQLNSGMKVMEGSLVDNNDVLKTGQGQPLFIKSTAPLGMDSVQQIQPPAIPPTTIQLSEILSKELQEISGVNEELLGLADDSKAGILAMVRQGAGLVTLQKLFDQLDLSQKLLGEKSIQIIQKNWTYGKIQRILGKEPTDQFMNKAFQKYDCTVAEGLLTETQRKLEYAHLMEMVATQLIPIPPDIIIDKAPISGKKDLKEAIQRQQQQQAETEKERTRLELEQIEVDNQTKLAFSHSQDALANERMSKIKLDQAVNMERLQQAETDKTEGILNLAKALKEIDLMDLDGLKTKVQILKELVGETTNEKNMQKNASKSEISP